MYAYRMVENELFHISMLQKTSTHHKTTRRFVSEMNVIQFSFALNSGYYYYYR